MKLSQIAAVAALAITASSVSAYADNLEIIVPFSAGGGTDTVARMFEPDFSKAIGKTSIIRNVAGASATLGAAQVLDSKPDGATIGYMPIGPISIQPFLRKLTYGTDSFSFICQTTSTPIFLLSSGTSGINTVEDAVDKGTSGRIVYGSSGPGTIIHIAMAAFSDAAGLNAVHLPFAGTGPAMNALVGGEIDLFADTSTVMEANNLKALAIFAPERSPAYPDVPTLGEFGLEGMDFSVWQGLVGPKDLDPAIVKTYTEACKASLEGDRFQKFAKQSNTGIKYRNPEEFEAFAKSNAKVNQKILEDAGLVAK